MEYDPQELAENKNQASQLNHLEIDFESRKVLPIEMHRLKNDEYERAAVPYSYDCPKESELLSCFSTQYVFSFDIQASIKDEKLILYYQTLSTSTTLIPHVKEEVKSEMIMIQDDIAKEILYINQDIDNFNKTVKDFIVDLIEKRRKEIMRRKEQEDDLNDF